MGYAPIGVQGVAIQMSNALKELKEIEAYLLSHPDVALYKGKTLTQVQRDIEGNENFVFYD